MKGDFWLIKTDENGIKLWDNKFGGNGDDWCFSVAQTSDGGFVTAGSLKTQEEGYNFWIIKTDSYGNRIWDKSYGGSEDEWCYSVQQTNDGGYILVGSTLSYGEEGDVWIIKTDNNGNVLWDKTFGGSKADGGGSIKQTSDGGYIVLGATYSYGAGNRDIWLIKIDELGNKHWAKTIGGILNDEGNSIAQTSDNGYIITGWTESFGAGDEDIWLIKIEGSINSLVEIQNHASH